MSYDDYGELSLEHEYHNLANDYYKIGEFDKAIEHYNKALELRPDLLETYFNRGLAYTRKGLYDKAMEDLNKVIELNPNLAEAFYTRGLVHEYKLEYDLAILDYNKALEVDPKYSKAETQRQVAYNKKASLAAGGGAGAYGGGPPPTTPGAPGGQGDGLTKFQIMEKPKMRFKDVAGLDKVKNKIMEYIVFPLKEPDLSKRYGKEAGGLWKPVEPESLAGPYGLLAVEARKMKPGDIAGPIGAGDHIFIMKLESKRERNYEPLDKVQKELEAQINLERRKEAIDRLGESLVEQAQITEKDRFVDFCLERIYQKNKSTK